MTGCGRTEQVGHSEMYICDGQTHTCVHCRLAEAQSWCISGFYEDEYPTFRQGIPTHEIESLVTAKEVRGYVDMLVRVRQKNALLRKELVRLQEEIAEILKNT